MREQHFTFRSLNKKDGVLCPPCTLCSRAGRPQLIWLHLVGLCVVVLLSSCTPTGRRVAPQPTPPPKLSAEEMGHQGEAVSRRLAPDPLHFNIPSATLAVLTNEVATDMAWKEHFILQGEQADSYVVVMSEGTTLGAQRRINITPTARGSEVLVLPPDEGIAAGIKERTFAYLTGLSRGDADISPQVQRLPYALSRVWTAVKETLIDAGFSFKTADADVGFIETEPVPVGKASRSWFGGSGQVRLIARPPTTRYSYKGVEWRYRIRVTRVTAKNTEVSVAAVVEAIPDASTLEQLAGGTLDILSVPFGSWISSAAVEGQSSRLVLPSRGKLEKDFLAGLSKKLPVRGGKSPAKRAKK